MKSKGLKKRLETLEAKAADAPAEDSQRRRKILAQMTIPELRNLRSAAEKGNDDAQIIDDPAWRMAHLNEAELAAVEHYGQLFEQEFQ